MSQFDEKRLSESMKDEYIEAQTNLRKFIVSTYYSLDVHDVEAAEMFARTEGILPAPESSHAIRVAIDEALKCKETGEAKNILFGLTGTGYFDLVAYQKFHDGEMSDYIPTDEDLQKSIAKLPKINK